MSTPDRVEIAFHLARALQVRINLNMNAVWLWWNPRIHYQQLLIQSSNNDDLTLFVDSKVRAVKSNTFF